MKNEWGEKLVVISLKATTYSTLLTARSSAMTYIITEGKIDAKSMGGTTQRYRTPRKP